MYRYSFKVLSAFLLLVCSVAHLSAISAEDIIKKARAYLGSEEDLRGVDSLVYKGHVIDASGERIDSVMMTFKKPNKQRLIWNNETRYELTAVNGGEGHKIHAPHNTDDVKLYVIKHEFVRQMTINAQENLYFFKAHKEVTGATVDYIDNTVIEGKEAYVLQYAYPRAGTYRRYIDQSTGAVLASEDTNGLRNIEHGFSEIAGIKFPKEFHAYDDKGKLLLKIVFDEVLVNSMINDAIFDFPSNLGKKSEWMEVETSAK